MQVAASGVVIDSLASLQDPEIVAIRGRRLAELDARKGQLDTMKPFKVQLVQVTGVRGRALLLVSNIRTGSASVEGLVATKAAQLAEAEAGAQAKTEAVDSLVVLQLDESRKMLG